MADKNALRKGILEKKKQYEEKIWELKNKSVDIVDLNLKNEKLKRWKEILDTLSWLLKRRENKANAISKLISSWSNMDKVQSVLKEVSSINEEIEKEKKILQGIELNTEEISKSIVEILSNDISISNVQNAVDDITLEIEIMDEEIEKSSKIESEHEEQEKKYKSYLWYIEKYLKQSDWENNKVNQGILENDIVYRYAKDKWELEILNKMETRSLSMKEYEDVLIKIDPIKALLSHKIYSIQLDWEWNKYNTLISEIYDEIENIDKWLISEERRKELSEECKKWIEYRALHSELNKEVKKWVTWVNNEKEIGDNKSDSEAQKKTDQKEDEVEHYQIDIEELISSIKKITDIKNTADRVIEGNKIIDRFNKIKTDEDKLKFLKWVSEKWWKVFITKSPDFKNILVKENDINTNQQTDWVFKTTKEYENFLKNSHDSAFALELIKKGKTNFLLRHITYFKSLNEEVLDRILEYEGHIPNLIDFSNKFDIEFNKFVIKLIESEVLLSSDYSQLLKRKNLNSELALKLITLWYDDEFEKLLKHGCFLKLSSDVVKMLVSNDSKWELYISKNKEQFELDSAEGDNMLDSSIEKLLWEKKLKEVIELLKKNEWPNKENVIKTLIEKHMVSDSWKTWAWLIAYHMSDIKWVNNNDIAELLLKHKYYVELWLNLMNFKNLDKSVAIKLLPEYSEEIAHYIKSFKKEDQKPILYELLKYYKSCRYIAKNLEKFRSYMDDVEIAKHMIANNNGRILAQNNILVYFKGLDNEVFDALMETPLKDWTVKANIAENISSFDEKYHREIMKELIMNDWCWFVVKYLDQFKWLKAQDYNEIFYTLLNSKHYEFAVYYLEKFPKNQKQQKDLIVFLLKKQDWSEIICKYVDKFNWLPYSWRECIDRVRILWGKLYINNSNELDYDLSKSQNFERFETWDIINYIDSDKTVPSNLLKNIDNINKEKQKEIIKRILAKNVRILTNRLSNLTRNEWIEKYNYFDDEVINYLIEEGTEKGQNKRYFILRYLDRFNVENKEELFENALGILNDWNVEKAIRYKWREIKLELWESKFVESLINHNYWILLIKYYDYLNFDNREDVVSMLINAWYKDDEVKDIRDKGENDTNDKLNEAWFDENNEWNTSANSVQNRINSPEELKNSVIALAKEDKWMKIIETINSNKAYLTDNLLEEINRALNVKIVLGKSKKYKYDGNTTKRIIANWEIEEIARNIDKFQWLNLDIALKALEWKWKTKLAYEIDSFDKAYHQNIAEEMISNYWTTFFLRNIQNFNITDYVKIANLMIDHGESYWVAENLEKFKWVNHKEFLEKLIEKKEFNVIIRNISKFKWITRFEIAKKFIDSGKYKDIIQYLNKFRPQLWEKYESPLELIDDNAWERIVISLRYFSNLDQAIAFKLILKWYEKEVISNLKVFEWRFNERITKVLLQSWYEKDILENIWKFEWLTFDFVEKLNDPKKVAKNIKSFKLDLHDKIAFYLIRSWNWREVVKNFSKFRWADKEKLTNELINKWLLKDDDNIGLDTWDLYDGNTSFANKLREFFSEYTVINEKLFKENKQEFQSKFKEKYWIYLFPWSWKSLLQVLWWKPSCTTLWYFKCLLKSKHEWDRYYSKYLQEKIKKRTTDAISEVLSKEWEQSIEAVDSEDQEQLNVVQKIKNELAERWIDPVFMELITEENEWEVNIQDVKDKFDEYREKNKESNISFDDVLEVFKQSWVECIWKLDTENWEDDFEDWSIIEEYSKENLWRIQRFMKVDNRQWQSFKPLINEKWEIDVEELTKWMSDNNYEAANDFIERLKHFWIKYNEKSDELETFEELNSPEEFIDSMEKLWYSFKNRDNFLKNLNAACHEDSDILLRLSDVVVKLRDLSGNTIELNNYIETVKSNNNKTPNFKVIKLFTAKNQPRIILELWTNNVIAILKHREYDALRWKIWLKLKRKREWLENRKQWM